jgi:hypothetical protein
MPCLIEKKKQLGDMQDAEYKRSGRNDLSSFRPRTWRPLADSNVWEVDSLGQIVVNTGTKIQNQVSLRKGATGGLTH